MKNRSPCFFSKLEVRVRQGGNKKEDSNFRILFSSLRVEPYLVASAGASVASAAVESAFSQQQHESAFSHSVHSTLASASVAACLLALPQQPTIAAAARTIAKEKIFFIALNV